MKTATLSNRPPYKLMKQSDIVSFYHMQMPRWLFCDNRYKSLSLESKVAYTFLLNRFQLSKMNGWVNREGEVFIIFTRESLAEEIGISYRKAIACFKELLAANLIWEQRIGRGNANHIYLAAVSLSENDTVTHESAPFTSRCAQTTHLSDGENYDAKLSNAIIEQTQDLQEPYIKECDSCTPKYAGFAHPDLQFRHSIKKELSNIDYSNTEIVSQSIIARKSCESQTNNDEFLLNEILDNSEVDVLSGNEAVVFENAITRLFYSESFKSGSSILPQQVVRSYLRHIDGMILLDTREKLRRNISTDVKNSTAYVMAVLFNNICEYQSDLMLDPFLNTLSQSPAKFKRSSIQLPHTAIPTAPHKVGFSQGTLTVCRGYPASYPETAESKQ